MTSDTPIGICTSQPFTNDRSVCSRDAGKGQYRSDCPTLKDPESNGTGNDQGQANNNPDTDNPNTHVQEDSCSRWRRARTRCTRPATLKDNLALPRSRCGGSRRRRPGATTDGSKPSMSCNMIGDCVQIHGGQQPHETFNNVNR